MSPHPFVVVVGGGGGDGGGGGGVGACVSVCVCVLGGVVVVSSSVYSQMACLTYISPALLSVTGHIITILYMFCFRLPTDRGSELQTAVRDTDYK